MKSAQRSPALTQKDVWDAADTLEAEGQSVSQHTVYSHLGRRGSMSTISRYLGTWRQRKGAIEELAAAELPIKPPDFIAAEFMDLWNKAVAEARELARRELDTQRKEVSDFHEASRKELELARLETRTLAHRAEEAEKKLAALQETSDNALRTQNEQISRLREETASLSAALQAERDRTRSLVAQIEEAKARLEQVRQEHREQIATEHQRREEAECRLNNRIEELITAAKLAQADANARRDEVERAQGRADQAQMRADQANIRADNASEVIIALRGEIREHQAMLRAAERSISDCKANILGLEKDLRTRTKELAARIETNETLNQAIDELRGELARTIDPGMLYDWIESGMPQPAGKAFADLRLRDLGRVIEGAVARAKK